jgi:hypothetical protein
VSAASMTRALAVLLLRLYPRAWRMRYEEEVRALLDDRAPDWRDVEGLLRGATIEWMHSVVDPLEHPVLSGILRGFGGWFAAIAVISVTAGPIGAWLQRVAGPAPGWVGDVAFLVVEVTIVRAFGSQPGLLDKIPIGVHGRTLSLGPMSPIQVRRWWAILWTSIALAVWSHATWLTSWGSWWFAPLLLITATRSGWNRGVAKHELWRLRRELRWASREHLRLEALVVRNLATPAEVETSAGDIARLNRAIKAAADALRTAQPISNLESDQTCR